MPQTPPRIALIGGGPTAVYTLAALARDSAPCAVTLFEREAVAGPGMPYREGLNEAVMLSNIASRELPPVTRSLSDFLRDCDAATLADLGVARDRIDDDSFYPRLVIGAYFTAELARVVSLARRAGIAVTLRTRTEVRDVVPGPEAIEVRWRAPFGRGAERFDEVVIATGHDWPDQVMSSGVRLLSPWPARKLKRLGGTVGILGSSLSAIDVAVTVAAAHGRFRRTGDGLAWSPTDAADDLKLVMMSRKGLLPEADWYFPLPLPPLSHLTEAAAEGLVADGPRGLLDRSFALLARDLAEADPAYAGRVRVEGLDGYADRHFAERLATDPWDWARANLAEAAADRARRHAVPWRRVLLTAHELFGDLVPHFDDRDLDRFNRELKPVFTDGYAAVPHRSIRRLLALRDAGRLELWRVPDTPDFAAAGARIAVTHRAGRDAVDTLVDARGQRAMSVADLGFPSIAGLGPVPPEGYLLPLPEGTAGRLHCLSLPVLLRKRPFVQGLDNAHRMGTDTAALIATRFAPGRRAA